MVSIRKGATWMIALAVAGVVAWAVYLRLAPAGPTPQGMPTSAPAGPGWENLLAEPKRGGWRNITDGKEIFQIEDDVLHIFGRTLYPLRYVACATERWGDFALHLEFKVAQGANSGVFLRAQPNDPVYRGFEIQVIDDHGRPPHKNGSGAIYDVVTPMFNLARPAGEWNSYDITVRGTNVVVIMNGWKVIDTDLALMKTPLGKFSVAYADLPREGLLMLQDHGGEVWYRNIRLKRL